MHGGLICIVICMYVCNWTKIQTRQKVTRQKVIMGILNQYRLLPVGNIDHMLCVANAACIQHTLHVHCRYTAGALQFRLGHGKGRWARFNVKLHFYYTSFDYF